MLNCGNCNNERKSNRKFCSRKCAGEFNAKQRGQKTRKLFKCEQCGLEFMDYETNRTGGHYFCSTKCSAIFNFSKPLPNCKICGKQCNKHTNTYCSRTCANGDLWASGKFGKPAVDYKTKLSAYNKLNYELGKFGDEFIKCEFCENRATDRHHPDYNHPTKVYFDLGRFDLYMYQAKVSKSERNEGLEGFEEKNNMRVNAPRLNESEKHQTLLANNHPTVKPKALLSKILKLFKTPNQQISLDPFMGSGSMGISAVETGFDYIGYELAPDYFKIAEARIENAKDKKDEMLF